MRVENQNIEPSFQPVEVFETVEDRTRREWAASGADWAYFIVRFLQEGRRLDIQPSEIVKTQLYGRSDDFEKHALDMVCATDHEIKPSPEDERRLRTRDNFLMDYVDRKTLGHMDLVKQLASIPAKVAERQRFDATLFSKVWESPRLFSWLWKR